MPFTALFLATAPDADPEVHRSLIESDLFRLFSVVVRDHEQAIRVCTALVAEDRVQSIALCPGHSHADVAAIVEAVGEQVSVSIARSDIAGMHAAAQAMEKAGWFVASPRR